VHRTSEFDGPPPARGGRPTRDWRHPTRIVPLAFLVTTAIGTLLLSMPFARPGDDGAPFLSALFTATSAVCVTGLTVVDTATYWSTGGHVVILLLFQIGGFGILTLGTLLALLLFRRLGLRTRLIALSETRSGLGDVTRVMARLATIVVVTEVVVSLVLAGRFLTLGYDGGRALWFGVFHGISAFNNAGFTLYSDGLTRFVGDPYVNVAVMVAVILGAVGTPVLLELLREARAPRGWSVHTRLTLMGTALVLSVGTTATAVFEWGRTLGDLDTGTKLMASAFHAVQHTAGFHTVDTAAMDSTTKAVSTALMFIGGGSASTAGGIKLSTFMLLAFVIRAEVRGDADVTVGRRRVPSLVQRQAVTIALLGVGVVGLGTLAVLATSDVSFEDALFDTTSAAATVGLSTGVVDDLPPAARVVLIVLMLLGRIGSVTAASALALRDRPRLYRLPEERPIVG
jgi:trk system potassium uptake protein TrkH